MKTSALKENPCISMATILMVKSNMMLRGMLESFSSLFFLYTLVLNVVFHVSMIISTGNHSTFYESDFVTLFLSGVSSLVLCH